MNLSSFGTGRKSSASWRRMWMDKFSDVMIKLKILQSKRRAYFDMVDRFLSDNPGNPRRIEITRLNDFLESDGNNSIAPLLLFFQEICVSDEHTEALKLRQETIKLLAAVEKSMRAQGHSSRTITAYADFIRAYLGWLKEIPSPHDQAKLRTYLDELNNRGVCTPAVLKKHSAALSALYSIIPDFTDAVKPVSKNKRH